MGVGSPNAPEKVARSDCTVGLPNASTMTTVCPVPAGTPLIVAGMSYAARMLSGVWQATRPAVCAKHCAGVSDGVTALVESPAFSTIGCTL